MKTKQLTTIGLIAAPLAVMLTVPSIVTVPYFLHLTVLSLIWVIVAQGQNLIQGYTGYVSIAQGAFMGIGAYFSALLSHNSGWPVWVTLPLAPFFTAFCAILVGYPCLRVKGHYFAIVTLACNLVIAIILLNYSSLTGGEAGIPGIPRPEAIPAPWGEIAFKSLANYYYLVLMAACGATLLCALIVRSRVGRTLRTIHQNEDLAEAIGIATWKYRLFAFTTSAFLAGLGGGLYAHFTKYINPTPFGVEESLNAILAVILGGSGTIAGPVVGAFAVIFLPEYLRIAETYRLIVYGLILVLATIFMPHGIVKVFSRLLTGRTRLNATAEMES